MVSLLFIIVTQRDGSLPTVVIQPPLCLLSQVVPYGRTHQCSIWHCREETNRSETGHICSQQILTTVYNTSCQTMTVLCHDDAYKHNLLQSNQLYLPKLIFDTLLVCQAFFSIKEEETTKGYTVVQNLLNVELLPGITWEMLFRF